MPYIEVWVDHADLEDYTDTELREELTKRAKRRAAKEGAVGCWYAADYRIPRKVALYALNDASNILRKQGRNDLAFKMEEVRVDYVEQ